MMGISDIDKITDLIMIYSDECLDEYRRVPKDVLVTHEFNNNFDCLSPNLKELSIDYLPKKIKCLIFKSRYTGNIDCLPENLNNLYFYGGCKKSVDNLPKNLKYIVLVDCFNKCVDHLPKKIKSIKMWTICLKI